MPLDRHHRNDTRRPWRLHADGRRSHRPAAARGGCDGHLRRAGRRQQSRSDRCCGSRRLAVCAHVHRNRRARLRRSRRRKITGAPGVCLTTLGPGAASVDERRRVRLARSRAGAGVHRQPSGVCADVHAPAARSSGALCAGHEMVGEPHRRGRRRDDRRGARTCADNFPRGPVHLDCPGDVLSASCRAKIEAQSAFRMRRRQRA